VSPRKLLLVAIFVLTVGFISSGCARLQPGYYLTPGHFPTLPPTETLPPTLVTPSETPVSTVQGVATLTLTPFGATAGPTLLPSLIPTNTLQPCDETHGQIVETQVFSTLANHDVRYRVYLPPCYTQTARRYPVLVMLHGLGEGMNDSQWDRMGLPEAADLGYVQSSLPPMIIVMPNGNDANYIWDAGPFPDMLVEELLPDVQAQFCTWNEASRRAIGGLSRGGYWALWIAFRNPDIFSRVGGHSPYLYDPEFSSDKNPFNLIDEVPTSGLAIYLDHGGENREIQEVAPGVQQLLTRLRSRGIRPEYVANPVGDHVEAYWASHTADYLAFYAKEWPREITTYPDCHSPSP